MLPQLLVDPVLMPTSTTIQTFIFYLCLHNFINLSASFSRPNTAPGASGAVRLSKPQYTPSFLLREFGGAVSLSQSNYDGLAGWFLFASVCVPSGF
jgi:hypothetical protein